MTAERYETQVPSTSLLLGDCYENSIQMAVLCAALDRQIAALYAALNRLLDVSLITANDETLSLWEKELALGYASEACSGKLTAEQRRLLLRQYLCRRTPVTEKRVRRFLGEIADSATYTNGADGVTPTIKLKVQTASLAWEIRRYLNRIFPAHMMPHITEVLRTHNLAATRKHSITSNYTHAQLRND